MSSIFAETSPVVESAVVAGILSIAVGLILWRTGSLSDAPARKPTPRPEAAPVAPRQRKGLREGRTFTIALLIGILAVGAGVRVWELDAIGFNTDEAVYTGQAATMADTPVLKDLFPTFRAHPLLYQFVLSIVLRGTTEDVFVRLVGVAFGLATVLLVYHIGALLYGRTAGLWAALFLALMPYHVIVTRQALLDGPMTLFATASLYSLARFAAERRPAWLNAAAAMLGLTLLTKESGVVLLGSVFVFLALSSEVRVRAADLVRAGLVLVVIAAAYPISVATGGAAGTAKQFLIWQLFRKSNHEWSFYATTVPSAIGPLLMVAAVVGLLVYRRRRGWSERLLLAWIAVPAAYFQLWPVKGYQYLLPITPAIALLAAKLLTRLGSAAAGSWGGLRPQVSAAAGVVIVLSLATQSAQSLITVPTTEYIAGKGGVPGGREMGRWVSRNVPEGATFMTIGPSMANIVRFYGHRVARGLSVSPDPLRRNPAYEPVRNPDLDIRTGVINYLVYDVFSASRSEFFGDALRRYAARYNGVAVYTEYVAVTSRSGERTRKPVIILYEVRP